MSADGELGQILRFLRRTRGGRLRRGAAHGPRRRDAHAELPLVWQLNAIHVDDPEADAGDADARGR